MHNSSTGLRYPHDIVLDRSPLVEAWLEIRWKVGEAGSQTGVDPDYPFALGVFRDSVKDQYGYIETTDANRVPEEVTPHMVRYRFRPGEKEWPLLQLGPGIATVNAVGSSYANWRSFKSVALYLRKKLLKAYEGKPFRTDGLILRFRNAEVVNYSKLDAYEWLDDNLNTQVNMPETIPGFASRRQTPSSVQINLSYELVSPAGQGSILIATGNRKLHTDEDEQIEEEVIVWELVVASRGSDAPDIEDQKAYTSWLEESHNVLHEWFFSLIEGPLMTAYKQKAD